VKGVILLVHIARPLVPKNFARKLVAYLYGPVGAEGINHDHLTSRIVDPFKTFQTSPDIIFFIETDNTYRDGVSGKDR
jgi:hypothetical protein